jgi:hypothetical protein
MNGRFDDFSLLPIKRKIPAPFHAGLSLDNCRLSVNAVKRAAGGALAAKHGTRVIRPLVFIGINGKFAMGQPTEITHTR